MRDIGPLMRRDQWQWAAACFVPDARLGDDADLFIFLSITVSCTLALVQQLPCVRCPGPSLESQGAVVTSSDQWTSAASDQRWRHPASAEPHQPGIVTAGLVLYMVHPEQDLIDNYIPYHLTTYH